MLKYQQSELKSKEIVECINEEARKGRLYRLTDTGKEVLESINEKEEENWNCTFHTSFNNYIFLFLCFFKKINLNPVFNTFF